MESRSYADGNKRAILIAFDQSAIANAVGTGTLDSAFLELPVRNVAYWPSGGGVLWLNRMLQAWTETGATAVCAIDNNTSNNTPDCPSTAWGSTRMLTPQTDSAIITNSTSGWTRLRVTPDVQAWLGGAPNYGWGFGNLYATDNSTIWYGTREASTKPRLVLWVTPAAESTTQHLLVIADSGVLGTPAAGDSLVLSGDTVHYAFGLQSGYQDLRVFIDGDSVADSGMVVMDTTHVLEALSIETPVLPTGDEYLLTEAQGLLTAGDKPAAFQGYLNDLADFVASKPAAEVAQALYAVNVLAYEFPRDSAAVAELDNALADHIFDIGSSPLGAPAVRSSGLMLNPSISDSAEPVVYLYVNGVLTSPLGARTTAGNLSALLGDVSELAQLGTRKRVHWFYNRSEPYRYFGMTPAQITGYCMSRISEFGMPHGGNFELALRRCKQDLGSGGLDFVEAVQQYVTLMSGSSEYISDAYALADSMRMYLGQGNHLILVGHSQGNLLIQEAMHIVSDSGWHVTTRDSTNLAAIALAAPSSVDWRLAPSHLAHYYVQGDPIGPLSSWYDAATNVVTPLASALIDSSAGAAAELEQLGGLTGGLTAAGLLIRQLHWDVELHSIDESYLGQPGHQRLH